MRQLSVTWKRAFAGALFIAPWTGTILKWLDKLVGWGGSLDFLISRSQDPGWLGAVLYWALNPPEIVRLVFLLVGVWVLMLAERQRYEARTDAKVAAAIGQNVASAPVVQQEARVLPNWHMEEIANRIMIDVPRSEVNVPLPDYFDLISRKLADFISLDNLTVWGRRGRLPLEKISQSTWNVSVLSVRDNTCSLVTPSNDTLNPIWYNDLMLNREEAEHILFKPSLKDKD